MTDSVFPRAAVPGLAGVALALGLMLAPAAAGADPYTGTPSPRVAAADTGSQVLGTSQERASSSSSGGLAVTGSDVLPLTVIGLGALGAGTALVLKNRSRQAT